MLNAERKGRALKDEENNLYLFGDEGRVFVYCRYSYPIRNVVLTQGDDEVRIYLKHMTEKMQGRRMPKVCEYYYEPSD